MEPTNTLKAPFSYLPALPIALGLCSGIIASDLNYFWIFAAISIIIGGILYFTQKHYASFFFISIGIGSVLAFAHRQGPIPNSLINHTNDFSAKVISVEETPMTTKCIMALDSCNGIKMPSIKCIVYLRSTHKNLDNGARIRIKASLQPLSSKSKLIPHEIDYQRFLFCEGISCVAQATEGSLRITEEPKGLDAMMDRLRRVLYNAIIDSPINGNTAAFLLATILGDDIFLSEEIQDNFRATGIAHTLALSGLHVGIIASLLSFLFFPTRLLRHGRYVRGFATIFLIWVYAFITGLGPSVTRAATMLSVYMAANMIQRNGNPYNSLCLAAIAILCFRPTSLFTPGFQLSFAAVLSIVLFSGLIPKKLRRYPVRFYLLNMLLLPIAAMLGTGIISLYYFNCFPWIFLVSNIFIGLLFPYILGGGIVLMLFSIAGISFRLLGCIVDSLYTILEKGAQWLTNSAAYSDGIFISPYAILPYALGLILCVVALKKLIYKDAATHSLLSIKMTLAIGGAFFLLSFVIMACVKERIPQSEIYIPSGPNAALIARCDTNAWLIGINSHIDTLDIEQKYSSRFSGYLKSRKCSGFKFMKDSVQSGPFYYNNGCLIAGNTSIAIVNTQLPTLSHATYAIIGKGFKSNQIPTLHEIDADTLLISKSLNYNVKQKITDELKPTPYYRLGNESKRIRF